MNGQKSREGKVVSSEGTTRAPKPESRIPQSAIRRFAIVSNRRPESMKAAKSALDFLAARAAVEVERDTATMLGLKGKELEDIKADAVVCMGGDGTILHCLRKNDAPVFGINTSAVGFLAESAPDRMKGDLEKMLAGKFLIEETAKISAELGGMKFSGAVNEIAVKSDMESKVIRTRVRLDGETIEEFCGDGILVSTPVGSTAYAMSAGGPIVDPRVGAFLVVPVAPFRFGTRPIIVPDSSGIEIEITGRSGHLLVDGFCEAEVREGNRIQCRKSEEKGKFIRLLDGCGRSRSGVSRFYCKVGEKLR